MADTRERQVADDRRRHGENGSASGRIAEPGAERADAIAESLKHLAEVAIAQQRKARTFTTTHSASIGRKGALFPDLHLPEEAAIGGAYIENNSAVSTLTLYEGSGSSGRVIGVVGPSHWKRIAFADHLSSLSIVADQADPSAAIVFVTLTTRQWSPTQGALT